jgi:hypothetical protein
MGAGSTRTSATEVRDFLNQGKYNPIHANNCKDHYPQTEGVYRFENTRGCYVIETCHDCKKSYVRELNQYHLIRRQTTTMQKACNLKLSPIKKA